MITTEFQPDIPTQNSDLYSERPDIDVVLTNGGLADPMEIAWSTLDPRTSSIIIADKYIRAANVIREAFGECGPHVSLSVLGGRMVDSTVMFEGVKADNYSLNPTSFDMPDVKTWYDTLQSLIHTPLNKSAPRSWANHLAWHQLCVEDQNAQLDGLNVAARFWKEYQQQITSHKVGIRMHTGQIISQPQLVEAAMDLMHQQGLAGKYYISLEIDAAQHSPADWLNLVRNMNILWRHTGVKFTASADLGHLEYAFKTFGLNGNMYDFLINAMGYPDNVFSAIELHAHTTGPDAHESIQKLNPDGLIGLFHAWGSQTALMNIQNELGIPSEAIIEDVWPNSSFIITPEGIKWLRNNVVNPYRAGVRAAI